MSAHSPSVWTIAPWQNFADALVAGVLAQFGEDRMAMARGLIIAPNNRAVRAIRDAFVRVAEPALLMPRLVTMGDDALGEQAGLVFDDGLDDPVPPAIDPLHRRLILARLIAEARPFGLDRIDAAMAVRLAGDLAQVLDQMIVERVKLEKLTDPVLSEDLAKHWQASSDLLRLVERDYPAELRRLGVIDLTDRRNRLLDCTAERWTRQPPTGFVIAAGISTVAPAIARLLRVIATLPQGRVVLSGLDLGLGEAEWAEISGSEERRGEESHPQYHLSLLLDRMGVSVTEVRDWPTRLDPAPEAKARAVRSAVVSRAMAPAAFTADWFEPRKKPPALDTVAVERFASAADEAQGIAVALRGALETPGRTAALITPDRALANRVCGHLKRWGIEADDSAGKPLSTTLAGGLLLALAEAAANRFAPAALLGLIKHPLVRAGEERRGWMDGARWLDAALRGPRPAPGLGAIAAHLATLPERDREAHGRASDWWRTVVPLLEPLDTASARDTLSPAVILAALRETALTLGGESVWSGQEGRAVADLLEAIEALAGEGPQHLPRDTLAQWLRTLLDTVSVRPARGGHHRLFVWGLLEARLQSADLVIMGGMNEGVWPQLPTPDPFLSPRMRRELGLPGLDFRVGLSAHDFALALGAKQVIITRAARDATAPTIESRFLLRLTALARPGAPDLPLATLARQIDRADGPAARSPRPAPCPPVEERPRRLSISDADRLVTDPYGFYASRMLGLSAWRPIDGPPDAAWRGTLIHGVLQGWGEGDDYAPGTLIPRLEAALNRPEIDPALRAFGLPRLREAMLYIEGEVTAMIADGRKPVFAEERGEVDLGDIILSGKPDRIDALPGGGLAIIDYKSGDSPKKKQTQAGFALQLGLLGVMARMGAFKGAEGDAQAFEYWRLNKNKGSFGRIEAMDTAKDDARALDEFCHEMLERAVGAYITGDEAFVARLHPEYARFGDYDHLMRLEEWYGPQG